jgi:hypothetical protein
MNLVALPPSDWRGNFDEVYGYYIILVNLENSI